MCGTRGNNAGRGSSCKGLLASARSVSTVMIFFSSSVQSNREFLSILALLVMESAMNQFFFRESPLG